MPEICTNIKTLLKDLQGKDLSSTAKLVAILESCGVTDRDEVEALLEAKASTIREAKRALKIQRQKSSAADTSDGNPAPEIQRCDGIPALAPEIQRQKSSVSSRARANTESLRDSSLKDSSVSQSVAGCFNDATQAMVADVLAFMGPIAQEREAKNWLTGTIAAYGAERTARAWTIITTKRAAGQPVPNPLALWSKTAQGLKANHAQETHSSADVLPFKVSVAMHPNARPRDEVMGAANA